MTGLLIAVLALGTPAVATAAPPTLGQVAAQHVAVVEQAAAAASDRDPAAVQARYDAARDLQVAISGHAAPRCSAGLRHLARFAAAHVRSAEAFDRLRPYAIPMLDATAGRALGDLRRERACMDAPLVSLSMPPAHAAAARRVDAVLAGGTRPRPPQTDRRLGAKLRVALRRFPGAAAVWVHDLNTGRAAAVGAADRYPAASTVKLGVLVAALARYGEARAIGHDLEAMTSWSSNLAANRLWRLVGGDAAVEATLRRLGAGTSTYPGPYRAGTTRTSPPLVSRRVTTARDLGRILGRLHGAALGRRGDLRSTRLTRREARIALGLLMVADDREGALVPPVPAARKHGWLRAARLTAAILFGPRGPVIVVLLTYDEGIPAITAQRLGRRVAAVALA